MLDPGDEDEEVFDDWELEPVDESGDLDDDD